MLEVFLARSREVFSSLKRPASERIGPVLFILYLTIPTGITFALINYLSGNRTLAMIEFVVMVFVLMPVFWLTKKGRYIGLCEHIVMLAAVLMFGTLLVTGGKAGAGNSWMFIIPFVAFYINDQRAAWKWIGVFFLMILGHLVLAELGYMSAYYSTGQLAVFLAAFLFYAAIAYVFNSYRNRYSMRLESQVAEKTRELQANVDQFSHLALFDTVTDLPNRRQFIDKLGQAIEICCQQGSTLAVVVVDLDRFQEVNNIMGHDKGDIVLRQMGRRISRVVRSSDTVAHIGGDTFALILPDTDQDSVGEITGKIVRAMEDPFVIQQDAVELPVHIGISIAPMHGRDPRLLLQRADLAMRQAKAEQMGITAVYDQEQDPYSFRRLALFGKLRKAISNGGLSLVYQPKVGLDSMHIAGVEALLRWDDADEGSISPEEFIPMAEQTGIMDQLSAWVLETAVTQAAAWKKQGISIPVAINLSPQNLLDSDLAGNIKCLLDQHGLNCHDICIEVTETALMTHPEKALSTLTLLHEMGISISIDDFGTGYSSLAYLKMLPVDELKIDQCFVSGMLKNRDDMMIVKSTIELARGFGLSIVAEGVEEEETLHALKELGASKAQGYYLSRPLAAGDFQKWLVESEWGIESPGLRLVNKS